jgi:hypothetical protein
MAHTWPKPFEGEPSNFRQLRRFENEPGVATTSAANSTVEALTSP